jgi:hypothetical protein
VLDLLIIGGLVCGLEIGVASFLLQRVGVTASELVLLFRALL